MRLIPPSKFIVQMQQATCQLKLDFSSLPVVGVDPALMECLAFSSTKDYKHVTLGTFLAFSQIS